MIMSNPLEPEITEEESEEKEKLERELSELALSKTRLESAMKEATWGFYFVNIWQISNENRRLRDSLYAKEEDKTLMYEMVQSLREVL
jgi:hypothetical protein